MKTKAVFSEKLLEAADYRSFLRQYFHDQDALKKVNYSSVSRACGFTSRSFLKEVIEGKKSLSPQSAMKIKAGLKFSGTWGLLFEALVNLEDPAKIEKIKSKLRLQLNPERLQVSSQVKQKLFLNRYIPDVFASLGSKELGASEVEILSRSGLTFPVVAQSLSHLLELDVIEKKSERYYVKNTELDIFSLEENLNFQNAYLQALSHLKEKAEKNLKSESQLFLHSAFSVSKQKLPLIKEKLRNVIIDFMNEEQNDDGDRVMKITLGMTGN